MHLFIRVLLLVGAGILLSALASPVSSSDVVTLRSGGVLRGKATKSAKTVTVTTATGAQIVVDRSTVTTIKHDSTSASNSSRKVKLTSAQEAWLPKVRKLVNQANSQSADISGRALRDLRSINDSDAIPALTQSLRISSLDSVRLLYVQILGNIPGPQAAAALTEEALFDSSMAVRTAAQQATIRQPHQNVRPYYGQALRFPNRAVVCRAATVLASVGDEKNVPALIDSLYTPTVDYVSVLQPSCSLSRTAFLLRSPGASFTQRYSVDQPESVSVPVVRNSENPQVLEALQAITKQSFGYNPDAWRRWWKLEQLAEANRLDHMSERSNVIGSNRGDAGSAPVR